MNPNPQLDREALVQQAIKLAMLGTAAAAAAPVIAQDAPAEDLEEIIVTGSRIRRVDAETASPVVVINSDVIQASGATTIGELALKLPTISGGLNGSNPATNNGGGDGATNIELRGLSTARTLVLLNGRRYGALGQLTSAVDVNSIPVNMIERVEVLKEGAGAIYGSDAIGGVVNFITKKNMDGGEITGDFGKSSRSDGTRKGVSVSWGTSGDRGNVILGFNYNQQDSIGAGNRPFSANAIYFYGSVTTRGSSRVPTGRIFFEDTLRAQYGCPGGPTSASVTRRAGAAGTAVGDFRCYIANGATNDAYNFQPENLILTPQERSSIFSLASFNLTEDIELYTEFLYNYTTSGYKIAPLPFDTRSDNVVISADNIYNPFGVSFGGTTPDPITGDLNPNATLRLSAVGNRRGKTSSYQGALTSGLRGKVYDSGWNWDANVGYSRLDQRKRIDGYLFKPGLTAAFGPSFINAQGQPTCGTVAAPISGCTPANFFNLGDPAQVAALRSISAPYNSSYDYTLKQATANFDGPVFSLPAGEVQAAVGAEYRENEGIFDTDFLTESTASSLFKDCQLANEACGGDSRAKYDVREVYAEVLVPILKDAPFATALNLTVGGRYSKYSTFGSTTNGTYKVEWRPIDDLLVRGTFADIFRAPSIIDLSQAPTSDAATFSDPCVGLTQARVTANPNLALACVNVPRDGSFTQANSQVDALLLGSNIAGFTLKPETGDVFTFGFVYEPQWLSGLNFNVDFWDYSIDNVITQLDVNTTATNCAQTGSSQYCGYINRFPDGSVNQIQEPTVNLGALDTSGMDVGIHYNLRGTGIGDFNFGVDATHTDKYDSTVTEGEAPTKVAGYYDRQYGNYAKWRTQSQVGWSMAGLSATVVYRFIDKVKVTDPDGSPEIAPDLEAPSRHYFDLLLGYNFEPTNTKVRFGVNNITDQQPIILYQNNVTNANTDVGTYDTIGRYYFLSLTQKF